MSLQRIIAAVGKGKILLPILQDFAAKIFRLQDEGVLSRKDVTIRDAKLSIRALERRIEEFNHGLPSERLFHPSALGACLRAIWFSHFHAPKQGRGKEDALRSWMIFDIGSAFHLIVQNLCARAKVLERAEVAIVDRKLKIIGHCDGIVKIDGVRYALEIKTINSRGFLELRKSAKDAHLRQLHAYMKALGLEWGIFLYYNKDTSEVKEIVVPFDQAFYVKYVEGRINSYFSHVTRLKVPEREGLSPDRAPCSYCDFQDLCYNDRRVDAFQTKLRKHEAAKEEVQD